MWVKCINVDENGKIRLSRRAALEEKDGGGEGGGAPEGAPREQGGDRGGDRRDDRRGPPRR